MAGAAARKTAAYDEQNPTPIDRQITESERTMPTPLPSASNRLDMPPAPAKPGTGAPEKTMTQAERDAEIKRQKTVTDAAYQAYVNRGKK